MKFIQPLEISSKIMTLIEDANKELILVSPYVEISKWDKMKKCLQRAIDRKVSITFAARKNAKQDLSFLEQLGIKIILVNDLHAKLYINENYGIITSQNIVYYSDINSIDIAYKTEDINERQELMDFVTKYIIVKEPSKKTISFEKVNSYNYDKKVQLNDNQLQSLWVKMMNDYPTAYFKKTSSYIFCGDIFKFADVMIDTVFTIKINKKRPDVEPLIHKLQEVDFQFFHQFKVELLVSHKSYYYIEFTPLNKIDFNRLQQDYVGLINTIIKHPEVKNLTV